MADGKPRFSAKGRNEGLKLDVAPVAGGWSLKRNGPTSSVESYPTKTEAVAAAKASLQSKGGALRIHSRNGRIQEGVTLGRVPAAKISAVEGISLEGDVRLELEGFDRQQLSPAERRDRIGRQFGSGTKSRR
jgi:hypothetical protein